MGDNVLNFGSMDAGAFADMLDAHAKQKFNHIRGAVLAENMFPQPGPHRSRRVSAARRTDTGDQSEGRDRRSDSGLGARATDQDVSHLAGSRAVHPLHGGALRGDERHLAGRRRVRGIRERARAAERDRTAAEEARSVSTSAIDGRAGDLRAAARRRVDGLHHLQLGRRSGRGDRASALPGAGGQCRFHCRRWTPTRYGGGCGM